MKAGNVHRDLDSDQQGEPIVAASVVKLTRDLEVQQDGVVIEAGSDAQAGRAPPGNADPWRRFPAPALTATLHGLTLAEQAIQAPRRAVGGQLLQAPL